jgi:hypothetical protein
VLLIEMVLSGGIFRAADRDVDDFAFGEIERIERMQRASGIARANLPLGAFGALGRR